MDAAVLWSCQDEEELTCTTMEEAVEEYIDECSDIGEERRSVLERICPIKVTGYAREPMDMGWVETLAEDAVQRFEESLLEEYGDPNEDKILGDEVRTRLEKAVKALFREVAGGLTVWRCRAVETKVLGIEEIEELLR